MLTYIGESEYVKSIFWKNVEDDVCAIFRRTRPCYLGNLLECILQNADAISIEKCKYILNECVNYFITHVSVSYVYVIYRTTIKSEIIELIHYIIEILIKDGHCDALFYLLNNCNHFKNSIGELSENPLYWCMQHTSPQIYNKLISIGVKIPDDLYEYCKAGGFPAAEWILPKFPRVVKIDMSTNDLVSVYKLLTENDIQIETLSLKEGYTVTMKNYVNTADGKIVIFSNGDMI
jgi:hypothetical protein